MDENKTTKALEAASAIIVTILAGVLYALLAGSLVYLLWPVAIPAAFPTLVAIGTLAAKLTWWQAICFSWLLGLLIRTKSFSKEKN